MLILGSSLAFVGLGNALGATTLETRPLSANATVAEAPAASPSPPPPPTAARAVSQRPLDCAEALVRQQPREGGEPLDRLLFESGEYLLGDLLGLEKDKIAFDSDQLGDINEDFEDVVCFASSRVYSYIDRNLKRYDGKATIDQSTVIVQTASGEERFPRASLFVVLPHNHSEADRYALKLMLGFTGRTGNTESGELTGYLFLKRQDHLMRAMVDGTANIGSVNKGRTVQNWNGKLQLDVFVKPEIFFTPLVLLGQHNYFQNLDFRGDIGAGLGIDAVDLDEFSLTIGVIGAYQYISYVDVPAGDEMSRQDAVVGASTKLRWEVTGDIDFEMSSQTLMALTDRGRANLTARAALSLDVTSVIDIEVASNVSLIQRPPQTADGAVPRTGDMTVTLGLGLDID